MANENIFTSKVKQYTKGRHGYAQDAVDMIVNELLRSGDTVADIGSGTGIFSREFIVRGFETYCVEPNDSMRSEAEKLYSGYPNFHSVPASAEATTLRDGSIDVITAASAFHWFDAVRFKAECRRIASPGCRICLVHNEREYDEMTIAQHELCMKYGRNFTSLTHGVEKTRSRASEFFDGKYREVKFDFPISYTKDKFIARSLSSSYAPDEGSDEYASYEDGLRNLAEKYAVGDEIIVSNSTVVFCSMY